MMAPPVVVVVVRLQMTLPFHLATNEPWPFAVNKIAFYIINFYELK